MRAGTTLFSAALLAAGALSFLLLALRDDGAAAPHSHSPVSPSAARPLRELPEPVAPWAEWAAESPFRSRMRAMWFAMGTIAIEGGAAEPDYDAIECAADDIVRKAGPQEQFWTAIAEQCDRTTKEAAADRTDDAWWACGRIWKGCCDCHVENWRPSWRGFAPEVAETWSERGVAAGETPWSEAYFGHMDKPPENAYQAAMREVHDLLHALQQALDTEDAKAIRKAAAALGDEARARARRWRALGKGASVIRDAAEKGSLAIVRPVYENLAKECSGCHAAFGVQGRAPLDPPGWE